MGLRAHDKVCASGFRRHIYMSCFSWHKVRVGLEKSFIGEIFEPVLYKRVEWRENCS